VGGYQWLIHAILPTWEAEIRRILEKNSRDSISNDSYVLWNKSFITERVGRVK
jgi:hypothetical protein